MKKGLLIALGIGAAVLLLSKPKNPPCDARLVQLPSGEVVCETSLPAMGFILWTDPQTGQSAWYHRTQFQPPATGQFAGIVADTAQWQSILTGLITQGVNIAQMFQTTGGPSGGGSSSGGGSGGVWGITYSPIKSTKWTCRDGRYSNSPIKSGACAYHGGVMHKF